MEQGPDTDTDNAYQKFLDNPWLLLFLGLAIPFISYTAWGWIELVLMAPAKLP